MEPINSETDAHQTSLGRPHLIVIFAIVTLWLTASGSAADKILPAPIQLDPPLGTPHQQTLQWDATQAVDLSVTPGRAISGASAGITANRSRPDSVDMASWLANFDADEDPDGWMARIVLRDEHGYPVVMRAHANFELTPRVPLADHVQFMDADHTSMTWSMPLVFNEQGIASVKLPLRRSLEPIYGWSSAIRPSPFDRIGSRSRNNGRYRSGTLTSGNNHFGRGRSVHAITWRDRLDMPSTAVMRVRVSVPTEGVFRSATPVQLRPSYLLDSAWPYQK